MFPTENVAGNQMTRAPESQAYLFAETMLLENARFSLRFSGTLKYQDAVFFSETNQDTDTSLADAWSEADVRLALADADESWEIAQFGQNIFDERYVTQAAPFSGFSVASVNEPAKWGVQGALRF